MGIPTNIKTLLSGRVVEWGHRGQFCERLHERKRIDDLTLRVMNWGVAP